MPKEEWGVKRVCPVTGKRFYDLNRTPIVSPYTGETVQIDSSAGKTLAGPAVSASAKSKPKVKEAVADDDILVDDDDAVEVDDDLLEDDDDDSVAFDDLADVATNDDD